MTRSRNHQGLPPLHLLQAKLHWAQQHELRQQLQLQQLQQISGVRTTALGCSLILSISISAIISCKCFFSSNLVLWQRNSKAHISGFVNFITAPLFLASFIIAVGATKVNDSRQSAVSLLCCCRFVMWLNDSIWLGKHELICQTTHSLLVVD